MDSGCLPSGNLDITVAWSDLKKYESINDIWIQTGKRTRGKAERQKGKKGNPTGYSMNCFIPANFELFFAAPIAQVYGPIFPVHKLFGCEREN